MRALVLAFLMLLVPGCTAPAQEVGGPSCLERFAGPRGGNALLLGSLQDAPDVATSRLAEAMGERIEGEPRIDEAGLEWDTQNGTVRYERRAEHDVRLAWRPTAGAIEPRATIANALDALFAPPDRIERGEEVLQAWRGEAVAGTGARVSNGSLWVGPLFAFDPHLQPAEDAAVARAATDALACDGRDEAPTAEGLAVMEASLVRMHRAGASCAAIDVVTLALVELAPCGGGSSP